MRPTVALCSINHLKHNFSVIKEKVGASKIVAMVKANAYGHGIASVGLHLDTSVDFFGVASIDEALCLRESGVACPIILMQGIFDQNEIDIALEQNFHIVLHHAQHLEWILQKNLSSTLPVWLKINTGMCRLGFDLQKAQQAYETIKNHEFLKCMALMSHFACADSKDHELNQIQRLAFEDFAKDKKEALSFCNSAAIFHFEDLCYDYVRPGLALYGVSPIDGVCAKDLGLKPVMTLQTELMSVNMMRKGSCVGYNAQYICEEDMLIGVAPCGYGDGYSVATKGKPPILVNDVLCHVIGRVSMDMIAIDLRHCPNAKIKDKVTLWGQGLPIEEVAKQTHDITWRLLTGVSLRVPRVWI